MKRQYKIALVVAAIAALLTLAIATTVMAAQKLGTPERVTTPTEADYQAWGCPMANGNLSAVAALLGMTPDELSSELQQGKSLAEIATAKGVTEDKLVAAILDPMKEFMQQQVTAGVWTQAQLDARLKLAEQHIRQLINTKGDTDNSGGCAGSGMMNGTTGDGMMEGGMMGGGMMGGNGGYDGMMGGNPGTGTRSGMMGGGGGAY